MRGVFVTGTGTEVGKTVVAAAIARTLAAEGRRVAVFKPAVTGLNNHPTADGTIPAHIGVSPAHRPDHVMLREAAGSAQDDDEVAPYRYGPPMSPHLAAELAAEEIEPARLLEAARAAAAGADTLVCEGVGGLLVPLGRVSLAYRQEGARAYLVRDFAVELGLPLVIAARPGLGTINHTLLTIEAARSVGLDVTAVVLTPWPDDPSQIERSNRETIATLGRVSVETLPHLDLGSPEAWPRLRVGLSG